MPVVCLDMGCSGSSVVADDRCFYPTELPAPLLQRTDIAGRSKPDHYCVDRLKTADIVTPTRSGDRLRNSQISNRRIAPQERGVRELRSLSP
jgi:hypothetical protein